MSDKPDNEAREALEQMDVQVRAKLVAFRHAMQSDHPIVREMFKDLMVMTALVAATEINAEIDKQDAARAALSSKPMDLWLLCHTVLAGGSPSALAALENFIDVATSGR